MTNNRFYLLNYVIVMCCNDQLNFTEFYPDILAIFS